MCISLGMSAPGKEPEKDTTAAYGAIEAPSGTRFVYLISQALFLVSGRSHSSFSIITLLFISSRQDKPAF